MIFLLSLLAQASDGNLGGSFTGLSGYETGEDITASAGSLELLVSNLVGFLTIAAGMAFLIYFSLGGITWITAGGDKGKVEEAKSRMTNGAIGMIIIVASWSIIWIIGEVLGFSMLNLTDTIPQVGPNGAPTEQTTPTVNAPIDPNMRVLNTPQREVK